MDFSAIGSSLQAALGAQLPRILGAIVILVIGWIVAVILRAGVRRLLGMARLNSRIAETTEQKLDVESGVAAGVFWLIILITLIGVFNSLDLALASGPFEVLVRQIAAYIPHLVAGTVLRHRRLARRDRRARHRQSRARCQRAGRKAFRQRWHGADAQRASATCSFGWSF